MSKFKSYAKDPNGAGSPHEWQSAFRARMGIGEARAIVSEAKQTPRAILGVGLSATWEEIRRAYRQLALQHHPDRGGQKERFQRVSAAYRMLEDGIESATL